jgi:hypothetical protein
VLQQARQALGGDAVVRGVKTLSLEGPFRREMGSRQIEGTTTLVLAVPDRLHRSEEMEMPGGASVERITVLSGDTSWDDVQNRGGMGGGPQRMTVFRGPNGQPPDPQAMEQARTRRMKAELQRWRLVLLLDGDLSPTYAGTAASADGKADVLQIEGERGRPVRLFVDQQTHLPLMLSYQEVRPRMTIGPGGSGRGGRGPGRRGDGPPPNPEEIRRRMEAEGPPAPSTISMYFAEYQSVDGLMLPHRISQSVDGKPAEEWTIEKAKVNGTVKAELFERKSRQ